MLPSNDPGDRADSGTVYNAMDEKIAAPKRLPYVQEQVSRLFAISDKLEGRVSELAARLESITSNEKPEISFADSVPDPSTPALPPLAASICGIATSLERTLLRLEDLQGRIES